ATVGATFGLNNGRFRPNRANIAILTELAAPRPLPRAVTGRPSRRRLSLRPRGAGPRQALGRPGFWDIVELGHRLGARRQRHPRLLRRRVDVDVGRARIGIIHRADADETDGRAGLRIVAPHRDLAARAARDALTLPARRGRHHDLGLPRDVLDAIGLVERIE